MFADDWILTADLWCCQQPLCQVRHNLCPWTDLVCVLGVSDYPSGIRHNFYMAKLGLNYRNVYMDCRAEMKKVKNLKMAFVS